MFVFNRSVFAVLVPLALLLVVALWSNSGGVETGRQQIAATHQAGDEQTHTRLSLTASNNPPAAAH